MKLYRSAYFCLSQAAFLAACLFGLDYGLSYLRFAGGHTWLAWMPGVGIALLFAATVVCYMVQMRPVSGYTNSPRCFHYCLAAFIVACCFGLNLALTYLRLVHQNDWAAWKPGVGIALLFLSMLLSYIGVVASTRRAESPFAPVSDLSA